MLTSIQSSNFKGITGKPVMLDRLNVLVGANGAGKSNFVDLFRFIHQALNDGISSAVGRRLGWNNVLTIGTDTSEKVGVSLTYDFTDGIVPGIREGKKKYDPLNCAYTLEVGSRGRRVWIEYEALTAQFKQLGRIETNINEGFIRRRNGVRVDSISETKKKTRIIPRQLADELFLVNRYDCMGSFVVSDLIYEWRFYDLDANKARQPCVDEGENILAEDGRNLAILLNKLKSSPKISRRILSNISILIPGFNGWLTKQQVDGSFVYNIKEGGMSKPLLPKMISDGTIRLLSILVALLYQPSGTSLICIDEPERYLHPQVCRPSAIMGHGRR